MAILIGPSKIAEVKTLLSRRFFKGMGRNSKAVAFVSSKTKNRVEIQGEDWVTYTINNFQEKTIQKEIAEIIGISPKKVDVLYQKDVKGFGDILRVMILT